MLLGTDREAWHNRDARAMFQVVDPAIHAVRHAASQDMRCLTIASAMAVVVSAEWADHFNLPGSRLATVKERFGVNHDVTPSC